MSPLPPTAGTRPGTPFTVPFPRPRPEPLDVHPADCPACRATGADHGADTTTQKGGTA